MVAGPPFDRAATHTAMNAPDVPMMSTCPAPDSPDADGLEDGRHAADYQGREDAPRDVGVRLPRYPRHDDHRQDDGSDDYRGGLQARARGNQRRRVLVRFVADVVVHGV